MNSAQTRRTIQNISLDDLPRYQVYSSFCTAHDIPYQTVEMPFEDRSAVTAMIFNQSTREAQPHAVFHLLPTRRLLRVNQAVVRRDRKSSGHFDHLKIETLAATCSRPQPFARIKSV
ncbi:MAG: hypothetical protein EAZ94_27280 [Oscillatoriales cyanobacterium]|uniref:hypothetical protein n=1 Tax=Microcoleus sp. PH2017_18_LLB_O_A TaxID=2798829 RepID=UPI001DF74FDB|nr:hypothetical protein [Microcoleus sp. PH2017_18_LLB_O_A]MCC3519275.1 hypothetical protein [Microcoleus sp. PH2017_18_LLB_O_A]TAE07828.1 MAG: hypothetical protein EAZ94_27280 [Oscillatoriales cyanobacterium]